MSTRERSGPEPRHPGHERDANPRRPVLAGATVLVLLMGLALAVVSWLQPIFVSWQQQENPPASPLQDVYGRVQAPAPRLQIDPVLDLAEHRRREEEILTTYGWTDRQAGIVRIPIDRAMELLVERSREGAP